MLNYKFAPNIYNGSTSCYEAAISSIVYNTFPDYSSLFTMFWGFHYTSPEESDSFIRERFIVGGIYLEPEDYYLNLFGLALSENYVHQIPHFLNILKYELNQSHSVVLSIDTYDCPWNVGYQKYHLEHFIVITGIREEDATLVCHDSFCEKELDYLPISMLELMKNIRFYTYVIRHDQKKSTDILHLLHQAAQFYLHNGKAYENIRAFARELADVDLYDNLATKDLSVVCLDPFFVKMKGVVSSRKNLLYFLLDINKDKSMTMYINMLNEICRMYNDAFLLLFKTMSRKGKKTMMQEAARIIMEVAVKEKIFAEIICGNMNKG